MTLRVGSRSSPLARAQVAEVLLQMRYFFPRIAFAMTWLETTGDLDRTTSLQTLGKTDFFTKELDEGLLRGDFTAAIHSAKDLPEPLPQGLEIAAITAGQDPADTLVLSGRPIRRVGVTSPRRIAAVQQLFPQFVAVDVRGTIGERLALLEHAVDALVVPEAALIRLALDPPRIRLPGETTPLQGLLAIVTRQGEGEVFRGLDVRTKTLYVGLDPSRHPKGRFLIHHPLIAIRPREQTVDLEGFTHIIATSRQVAPLLPAGKQEIIAVGRATAAAFPGRVAHVAQEECAEGVAALLQQLDLSGKKIFYPHSSGARPVVRQALEALKLDFSAQVLYDTVAKEFEMDLREVDEVFFTSPSSVRAFFASVAQWPAHLSFSAIGPVTKRAIDELSAAQPSLRI